MSWSKLRHIAWFGYSRTCYMSELTPGHAICRSLPQQQTYTERFLSPDTIISLHYNIVGCGTFTYLGWGSSLGRHLISPSHWPDYCRTLTGLRLSVIACGTWLPTPSCAVLKSSLHCFLDWIHPHIGLCLPVVNLCSLI